MPRSDERPERQLARRLIDRHPEVAARVFEEVPVEEAAAQLARERVSRSSEILKRLTPETAAEVAVRLPDEVARALLGALDPSRAAALLARLDAEPRDQLLASLEPGLAAELRELMAYPPDSAGHLMDPRATTFRPDARVRDAIARLRGLRRRRVQDVFLVDAEGRLVGAVPLQDVVLAAPGDRLHTLVRSTPTSVAATAPREDVLEALERQRGGSLAVTDFEGRLVGVLRQEELIEAAQQDATAALVSMVGASQDERALSTPLFAIRKRLPWLQVNLVTAFLAASVVGIFEDTIARVTALAVLLPVVAGQSGNTGAQALAVTMRGLALREIRVRHWPRVTTKEVGVGIGNGVAIALTTAVAVYVWSRSLGLALVIGLSMVMSMTAAGLSGAAIPVILTALRQDPAQSSSIILTTVTDVVGFFSFLGIATLLMPML